MLKAMDRFALFAMMRLGFTMSVQKTILLVFFSFLMISCLEMHSKTGRYHLKNVGSAVDLSVLTINILSTADLTSLAKGYPRWGRRKEIVFSLIEEQAPDLVSVQEASPTQFEDFKDRFSEDYKIIHRKAVSTDAFLMFKRSHFSLLEKGYEVLESPIKLRIPRIAMWVKLREKNSQREFMLVATHFDAKKFKVEEIRKIRMLFAEQQDSGAPLILAGDLNLTYGTDEYKDLMEGGWQDSYLGDLKHEIKTFPLKKPTRRIDHVIFFGDGIKSTYWNAFKPDGVEISDHLPVLVKLHIDSAKNP